MEFGSGTKVYAAAGGKVVDSYFHSAVGNVLVLREFDGPEAGTGSTYTTYVHLLQRIATVGQRIAPGELIALSGNTGSSTTGPHLHFQRGSVQPTFGESDRPATLRIPRIDGNEKLIDDDVPAPNQGPAYFSTNAGVGYDRDETLFTSFKDAFFDEGGWKTLGRPWSPNLAWMPCNYARSTSTHWRYSCSSASYSGWVQMLLGPEPTTWLRALARKGGSSQPVVLLREQFLYGYTELHNGKDFVHWIGYPTLQAIEYRSEIFAWHHWYQDFEFGQIRFYGPDNPGVINCLLEVHIGAPPPIDAGPYAGADAYFEYCGEPLGGTDPV